MSFQPRHRHHHSSRSPRGDRRRPLIFLGGLAAVLAVAIGLPILLSSPPTTAGPIPTDVPLQTFGPQSSGLPLPNLPTLVPVPQESLAPGATDAPPSPAGPVKGVIAKRIRIPNLSIDLKIVEGDGLDVPLYKAAHYPGSAWPNGGTNIYLYGHARDGMFINLWNARIGDQVLLDLVDGTTKTYQVDKIMQSVAWDDVKLLDPTPTEQLTLQTCVSYGLTAPRFVVIAHPVP
jgi:LPXTG-site transpeptidase (sortase) family protein